MPNWASPQAARARSAPSPARLATLRARPRRRRLTAARAPIPDTALRRPASARTRRRATWFGNYGQMLNNGATPSPQTQIVQVAPGALGTAISAINITPNEGIQGVAYDTVNDQPVVRRASAQRHLQRQQIDGRCDHHYALPFRRWQRPMLHPVREQQFWRGRFRRHLRRLHTTRHGVGRPHRFGNVVNRRVPRRWIGKETIRGIIYTFDASREGLPVTSGPPPVPTTPAA